MNIVGIIGCGRWGPVLLRNFTQHTAFEVKYVCDRNVFKREEIRKLNRRCILLDKPTRLFEDPYVDLIVIATQATYHFDLCMMALKANKHLFVEKPLTLSVREAKTIYQLASLRNKKIWVDHTFLFTNGYQKLKQSINHGMIGKPFRFHSTRTGFGLFPMDINVIWNLMYHDAYILLDLFGSLKSLNKVISVSSIVPNMPESILISATFQKCLHAIIHCDTLFVEKKREIIISGEKGILVWNEECQNKLIFYPYFVECCSDVKKVICQLKKIEIIKINQVEAIQNELTKLAEFLDDERYSTFPEEVVMLEIIRMLELVDTMHLKKISGPFVM